MAGLIQGYMRQMDDFFEKNKDPRLDGLPLMGSMLPGTLIVLGYLVVVTWLGPKLMESRKPYQIREYLIAYNFVMVAMSLYMVVQFGRGGWFTGYTYGCQLVETDRSPRAMIMMRVCYLFYISKFIEMLDTIFFILRKKKNQISFLHVFHHSIMPFSWWVGVRFYPGGFGSFHAFLNSFVHFVMYSYYGLAAIGPHMQKYLWWKKYITKLQLLQFAVVMIHSSQLLFIDCPYPKFMIWMVISYAFMFMVLFTNFYVQAYLKKSKVPSKPAHPALNGNTKSILNGNSSPTPNGNSNPTLNGNSNPTLNGNSNPSLNGGSNSTLNGGSYPTPNGNSLHRRGTDSNSNGVHKID